MFQVVFSAEGRAPRNYRELLATDATRYARLQAGLLRRGLHVNSSGSACWFSCTEHHDDDIALACEAIDAAFADLV